MKLNLNGYHRPRPRRYAQPQSTLQNRPKWSAELGPRQDRCGRCWRPAVRASPGPLSILPA